MVFVAGGGEAKGILAVADRARPEAKEAVTALHRYDNNRRGEVNNGP